MKSVNFSNPQPSTPSGFIASSNLLWYPAPKASSLCNALLIVGLSDVLCKLTMIMISSIVCKHWVCGIADWKFPTPLTPWYRYSLTNLSHGYIAEIRRPNFQFALAQYRSCSRNFLQQAIIKEGLELTLTGCNGGKTQTPD